MQLNGRYLIVAYFFVLFVIVAYLHLFYVVLVVIVIIWTCSTPV